MKNIIIVLVLLFFADFSMAQDQPVSKERKVKFGIKGGPNYSNLIQSGNNDMKPVLGFHIGGLAEFKALNSFLIQPEIYYSMQGAKTTFYDPDLGNVDIKFKLNYINVPIMAKYYVTKAFSIDAGPQIGFLVEAKGEGTAVVDGQETTATVDVKEFFKSNDFSINIGASYALEQGIFFSGRFNLGLSDIAEDNPDSPITNSVFQLSTGYKF
jgi:hypothetical protein